MCAVHYIWSEFDYSVHITILHDGETIERRSLKIFDRRVKNFIVLSPFFTYIPSRYIERLSKHLVK